MQRHIAQEGEALMQLLDSDAAARRLGVRRLRLYALVRAGHIPAVRMGPRSLRFDPSALDQFIRAGGVRTVKRAGGGGGDGQS
jgi:excisionase family DNA binding protein